MGESRSRKSGKGLGLRPLAGRLGNRCHVVLARGSDAVNLQDVPRLASKRIADGCQSREPDGSCVVVLQHREVCDRDSGQCRELDECQVARFEQVREVADHSVRAVVVALFHTRPLASMVSRVPLTVAAAKIPSRVAMSSGHQVMRGS